MKDYIKETLCFGLDIGTRTVIGVVGYKDGENFILVDYECKEHEERAMLDGQIHDIQKVSRCVYEVKHALEERLNVELKEVAIAAAGRSLSTQIVEIVHTFEEEQEITLSHIHHLELEGVEMAKAKQQQEGKNNIDYYCVAYTVISYYMDDYLIANLEGHRGNKISAKLIATFLPKQVIDSLYTVTERAELSVSHLTLEPIAAINAVIPEQIRLLNLALVDIGAGTSDIAITKEGSVVAYGMIPNAGDEVTEAIIHKYLVDFNMAEDMKKQAATGESVTYTDIIGLTHEISTKELKKVISPVIEAMTLQIAEKIILLNGNAAPNAVFCVGGGSQMVEVTNRLAHHLKLANERVALRSTAHLVKVKDEVGMIDSPQMITPLGICMTMIQDKFSQFTYVQVNGQKVQLLNAKKLTILDAIIASGLEHYQIFPKKGTTLMFKLDGVRQRIKGEMGTPATILLNDKEASIQDHIQDGDVISVVLAEEGIAPKLRLGDIVPIEKTVKVEQNVYELPLVRVGGHLTTRDYVVLAGDEITTEHAETVSGLFQALGISLKGKLVTKQFEPVGKEDLLMDGATYLVDSIQDSNETVTVIAKDTEQDIIALQTEDVPLMSNSSVKNLEEEVKEEEEKSHPENEDENLYVIVNNETVCLPHKDSDYIFAGIFDFIDFDLSKPQGTIKLVHNGKEGALTDVICDRDVLEIYWNK